MGVKKIYEGWKNHVLPDKQHKKFIERVSRERLAICEQCPEHSSNKENYKTIRPDAHCTNCGCTLSAKTKCLTCECPLSKWKAKQIENETE
jgi:hydrogenase maturation factor HypF (carbamoyltransferase family)